MASLHNYILYLFIITSYLVNKLKCYTFFRNLDPSSDIISYVYASVNLPDDTSIKSLQFDLKTVHTSGVLCALFSSNSSYVVLELLNGDLYFTGSENSNVYR